MDQRNGYTDGNLLGDNQQFNAYEYPFQPGADQTLYHDASWGVNASDYQAPSRVQSAFAPHANHLSPPNPHVNINGGQATPYARSLSHSPAPYGQPAFSGYGGQQNFQYQPQYDPALVPQNAFNRNYNYPTTTDYQVPNSATIAPHALENDARNAAFGRNPYAGGDQRMNNTNVQRPTPTFSQTPVSQPTLTSAIPKGNQSGYFSIIDFNALGTSTNSERLGAFANIGKEAYDWNVTRAALPAHVPRKSRNDLRKIAGNDPKLLAKLGKKAIKKERNLVSATTTFPTTATTSGPNQERIKYEGESPSEEESSSSDDDESSYTSDDADEVSPLPSKRPDSPREATEYDAIKALWRSKRKDPSSESIRKGLGDFWDIIKTIRDRWKTDVAAVTDAESKNRVNELPLLKSRVKDQRDMMEAAFKAALKYGHRAIVELFAMNPSLVYLCYQFLLDRAKFDDYNNPLARVMLEIATLFTGLTDEQLEKTHLVKVLPRYAKKGDAKTQHYAKRIIAKASTASKAQAAASPVTKSAPKDINALSPTGKRAEPEPVAGIKRAASNAGAGGAVKRIATGATKTNGIAAVTKPSTMAKKASGSDASKPAAGALAAAAKQKPAATKPSSLFSSLQSAGKRPGASNGSKLSTSTSIKPAEKKSTASNQSSAPKSTFSFMETMANLTKPKEDKPAAKPEKQELQETPEEKAKRLRKESRRHLRVSFKRNEDLVEVREFQHDPEEELDHDASQMRDIADVGGEGRMFKQQHQMMDVDDEEDAAEEESKLVEWTTPVAIDFSDVDEEERKRNFIGGGSQNVVSAERSKRDYYEANTLIVFYADANDIPPNPREPSDPYNGDPVQDFRSFHVPDEKYGARARQKQAGRAQYQVPLQQSAAPPALATNQQYAQPNTFQQVPSAPLPNDAISNILASLRQAAPNQAVSAPSMSGYGSHFAPQPSDTNAPQLQQTAPPPTGQPDLAAILAQIQQNQAGAAQGPAMGGFNFNPAGMAPNTTSYQPQAQQPTVYEDPERKQWREGQGDTFAGKNKSQRPPGQNPWYKTKTCKYWQEGRCQKGDACSYKHSE